MTYDPRQLPKQLLRSSESLFAYRGAALRVLLITIPLATITLYMRSQLEMQARAQERRKDPLQNFQHSRVLAPSKSLSPILRSVEDVRRMKAEEALSLN